MRRLIVIIMILPLALFGQEKKKELGIVEEEYLKSRKGRQERILKKLDDKLKAYRDWLLQITICDPACGSGAFPSPSHKERHQMKRGRCGHPAPYPALVPGSYSLEYQ